MTQDEIIEMAKEAGLQEGEFERYKGENCKRKAYMMLPEELESFAKLVAAKEREACAKICDEFCYGSTKILVEKAIRARGEA